MSTAVELIDLTDEERMIRDTARQFAQDVVAPVADELFETGRFPYEIIAGLAELGFMGILVAEEYGGVEASTTAYISAIEELSKVDVTTALTWQVHVLVTEVYSHFASDEQKAEWLPRMARGEILGGIAQAYLDISVAYAKERVQFGQPIGSFQAIQFRLADLAARIFCCRQAIYAAAKKRDLGVECEVEASMAKLISCRLGVEAADTAFHVFGGYGFSLEYPVAKLYADAKIMEVGEGTNEMQMMRIAKGLGL